MRTRLPHPIATVAMAALLAVPGLAVADDIVLEIVGATQGTILGTSTIHGRENWILPLSFQHGVTVPVGPNGAPSGAPLTSPVTLNMLFDRSTVKLMRAQANAENLTGWRLEWLDGVTGQVLIRYDLQNAHVIDVSEAGAAGSDDPMVSLSFAYSRVIITDLVNATNAQYDWNPASSNAPQIAAKGVLLAPSPNPTQGPAEFRFTLPADSDARLTLFDVRGHRVRELFDGRTSAEPTVATWDGTDDSGRRVAQGMYIARLTYPGREVTQRITVMR